MNPCKRRQRGFTLLEALVALVLMASTGMAVFGWINSSLQALARVEDHALHDAMIRNGLAYIETINLMASPSGEASIGPYFIAWASSAIEPERDGAGYPHGVSLFRIGLYDVHVTVSTDRGERTEFDVRQVGYRQERKPAG